MDNGAWFLQRNGSAGDDFLRLYTGVGQYIDGLSFKVIESGECLAGHIPVSGGGIAQDRRNIPVGCDGYRVAAFNRNNVAAQLHGNGATIVRIGSCVGELDLCADVSAVK